MPSEKKLRLAQLRCEKVGEKTWPFHLVHKHAGKFRVADVTDRSWVAMVISKDPRQNGRP